MVIASPISAPLGWSTLLGTWQIGLGWTLACAVLGGGYTLSYLVGLRRRRLDVARLRQHPESVPVWRAVAFLVGVVVLWVCVSSSISAYALTLFWMHMVMHLTLIMVVPALLVLGLPLTVAVNGASAPVAARIVRLLGSPPCSFVLHPVSGVVLYALVVTGTHLTDFLDLVSQHGWLVWGEQVLYVVGGYLLLTPLLGEEPLRASTPYLGRLAALVVSMLPDTVVGIVLLQTPRVLYPRLMSHRPAWTPAALDDLHVGGALMWAVGDGLMMVVAVGLMISVITSPTRRTHLTGSWLDGVRASTLADRAPDSAGAIDAPSAWSRAAVDDEDPDSDEAWEAYNRRLARLRDLG